MTAGLRALGSFCRDLVIGDDWRAALWVAAALAATYAASRAGIPSWWLLPTAVAALVPLTVWRAIHRR